MSAVSGISAVVSALDGMFGADYSHYNEMVEEYNKLYEIWDELIDKKLEYIGISYGIEADRARDEALSALGLRVLRYANTDVTCRYDEVCADILRHIDDRRTKMPSP